MISAHSSSSIYHRSMHLQRSARTSTNTLANTTTNSIANHNNNNNNNNNNINNMRAYQFLSTALFSTSSVGTTSTTSTHNSTILPTSSKSKSTFQPWPQSVIESKGDYNQESFLEQNIIGGPLYETQSTLPHLPIPTIQETISLFLKSALPLVENEQEKITLMKDCDSFPDDVSELQKRLLERKDECDKLNTSWLQLWWNQLGYLQIRVSIYCCCCCCLLLFVVVVVVVVVINCKIRFCIYDHNNL